MEQNHVHINSSIEDNLPTCLRISSDISRHFPNYDNKSTYNGRRKNIYQNDSSTPRIKCIGCCNADMQSIEDIRSMQPINEHNQKFQNIEPNRIYWEHKLHLSSQSTKGHDTNGNLENRNMYVIRNSDGWSKRSTEEDNSKIISKVDSVSKVSYNNDLYSSEENFAHNASTYNNPRVVGNHMFKNFLEKEDIENFNASYLSTSICNRVLHSDTVERISHPIKSIKVKASNCNLNSNELLDNLNVEYVHQCRQIFPVVNSVNTNLYIPCPRFSAESFNQELERNELMKKTSNHSTLIQNQNFETVSSQTLITKANECEFSHAIFESNKPGVVSTVYNCSKIAESQSKMDGVFNKNPSNIALHSAIMSGPYLQYPRVKNSHPIDCCELPVPIEIKKENDFPNQQCCSAVCKPLNACCETEANSYDLGKTNVSHKRGYNMMCDIPALEKDGIYDFNVTNEGHLMYYDSSQRFEKNNVNLSRGSSKLFSYSCSRNQSNKSVIVEGATQNSLAGSSYQSKKECQDIKKISHHKLSSQNSNATRKIHSKPNYRELINHVQALKNSTTEKDLNMKIISRALSYNAQETRRLEDSIPSEKQCLDYYVKSHTERVFSETTPHITNLSTDSTTESLQQKYKCCVTSPLDLSIKTINTKNELTENTTLHSSVIRNTEYKHSIPKVDFTPNFSKLETPENNGRSSAILGSKYVTKKIQKLSENSSFSENKGTISFETPACKYLTVNEPDAKLLTEESVISTGSGYRSMVIEENCNVINIKNKAQNSYPMQKNDAEKDASYSKEINRIDQKNFQIPKTMIKEENFNYFGRKRHLKEFTKYCQTMINESFDKVASPACDDKNANCLVPYNDSISSIVENKTFSNKITENTHSSEIKRFHEIPSTQQDSLSRGNITSTAEKTRYSKIYQLQVENKEEKNINPLPSQIKPLSDETSTVLPKANNSETSSFIAARIRTKAELKGFTFSNMEPKIGETTLQNIGKEITCRYEDSHLSELLVPLETLNEWGNTCNDLVEQLLGHNNKKLPKKRKYFKDGKIGKKMFVTTALLDFTELTLPNHTSSTDLTNKSCVVESHESTVTRFATCSNIPPVPQKKKQCKFEREKSRLHQEKRLIARLNISTSSESENELNKRRTRRLKKPTRKLKARTNFNKRRYSDCGSDTSSEGENTIKIRKNNLHGKFHTSLQCEEMTVDINSNPETINKTVTRKNKMRESTQNYNENGGSGKTNTAKECVSPECKDPRFKENKKVQHQHTIKTQKDVVFNAKRNHQKTTTRSKQKKKFEHLLLDGKILRNDKIVGNSATKIKRKYVKEFSKQTSSIFEEGANRIKAPEKLSVSTRSTLKLPPRVQIPKENNNCLLINKNKYDISKCKVVKKNFIQNEKQNSAICDNDKNQRQTELLLEVYRYKRALKIPPSLITIKQPKNHRISASLPDLEQQVQELTKDSQNKNKNVKNHKSNTNVMMTILTDLNQSSKSEEPKSIIDLLHSRMLKTTTLPTKGLQKHFKSQAINLCETNITSKRKNSASTRDSIDSNRQSPHFSVFDTQILKSRTRKEYKLQKNKEIIREIFVGDERPASAPPEITQSDESNEITSYEEKYEQFLQQMNILVEKNKFLKPGTNHVNSGNNDIAAAIKINTTQNNNLNYDDHAKDVSLSSDTQKRKKHGRNFRRKGSSGFDYIRKKKKPNQIATNSTQVYIKSKKSENELENTKTEKDVSKEIQKWVLNKGVGQSTLHKAARLGYIDVIVYCLERMGLNPNQKDNAGYTPLHEACVNGYLEIARVLLQYGANHSEAAHSGIRPLHEASENDHIEIVRMLLAYGADPLLATYSGQTPILLASSTSMKEMIMNHIKDMQCVEQEKQSWRFPGPWANGFFESGYDVLKYSHSFKNNSSSKCYLRRKRRNCPDITFVNKRKHNTYSQTLTSNCAVVLDSIDHFSSIQLYNENRNITTGGCEQRCQHTEFLVETSDCDGDTFEFEEADILLPPLYLLQDEGMEKWVLLSDLCNLLKVKSKDTLLNKISSPSSISTANKTLLRELKMSDFLKKATCLQLLCSGEKFNICASKVVLIKYNESVRNLLGVETLLMKF